MTEENRIEEEAWFSKLPGRIKGEEQGSGLLDLYLYGAVCECKLRVRERLAKLLSLFDLFTRSDLSH